LDSKEPRKRWVEEMRMLKMDMRSYNKDRKQNDSTNNIMTSIEGKRWPKIGTRCLDRLKKVTESTNR